MPIAVSTQRFTRLTMLAASTQDIEEGAYLVLGTDKPNRASRLGRCPRPNFFSHVMRCRSCI